MKGLLAVGSWNYFAWIKDFVLDLIKLTKARWCMRIHGLLLKCYPKMSFCIAKGVGIHLALDE